MKTIKVKTVDFNSGRVSEQENLIVRLLRKKYDVVISEEPDFLIYSVWGREHLKYDCTKLFYTSEPFSPNFNECDYAVGFDPMCFEPRYLRLPLSAIGMDASIQDRSGFADIDMDARKFCNFVYSNEFAGSGAFLRKEFCQKLMAYKRVDCPGMVLNNMDSDAIPSRWDGDWYGGKIRFLRNYKFTIAFENTLMDGYTTEKLVQPFLAGSIPIYYGNPRAAEEFNRRAFIDCNQFDNDFDAVIEEVKRVDQDAELAKYMVMQSPMRRGYDFDWESRLLAFLTRMIEDGPKHYDHMVWKTASVDEDWPNTLNFAMYRRGLAEGLREWKEIAIYGKGNFAMKIREFLELSKIDTASVCLVTKKSDAGGEFMGLPVKAIDDWRPETDAPLIIAAVREGSQEELIHSLMDRGFRHFLSVNDFLAAVIQGEPEHPQAGNRDGRQG